MELVIDGNIVKYEVQYNAKRKKFAIGMESSGLVVVKSPKNVPIDEIEKLVSDNISWIEARRSEMEERRQSLKLSSELGCTKHLYLGVPYSAEELLKGSDASDGDEKARLKKFYTASAKSVIGERLKLYEREMKAKAKSFKIVESKTKWGTCSSDKELTFNYRLVMAPIRAIDYVVVHELCHLDHMNHDRSFWRKVGRVMPDYKKQQEYLAKYGGFMI